MRRAFPIINSRQGKTGGEYTRADRGYDQSLTYQAFMIGRAFGQDVDSVSERARGQALNIRVQSEENKTGYVKPAVFSQEFTYNHFITPYSANIILRNLSL